MPAMHRRNIVRRMLIVVTALSLLGLTARAELFVVKMTLRVKVADSDSGNLSNVTLTASNAVVACGFDPETSTLVLDTDLSGSLTVVDNASGEFQADFATIISSDDDPNEG